MQRVGKQLILLHAQEFQLLYPSILNTICCIHFSFLPKDLTQISSPISADR